MIHTFVFVVPKPGMSEQEFFRYWKEVHAPLGAAIPQVLGYRICPRIPCSAIPATHPFVGLAEVWIQDGQAAIAMGQSKEYVEGARADEPNWLAFWQMVRVPTQEHILIAGPPPNPQPAGVKIVAMVKRKPGMPLSEFREYSLTVHGELDRRLPGLRRYHQYMVLDPQYVVGEPLWDCVSALWFDDAAAIVRALNSRENEESASDLENFVHPEYAHAMVVGEQWIVGPELRNTN